MKVLKKLTTAAVLAAVCTSTWQAVEVRQLLMEVRIRRRQRQSRRKR